MLLGGNFTVTGPFEDYIAQINVCDCPGCDFLGFIAGGRYLYFIVFIRGQAFKFKITVVIGIKSPFLAFPDQRISTPQHTRLCLQKLLTPR
jgi:hypothetical protein